MEELAFVVNPSDGVASLWDTKSGSRIMTLKQCYAGTNGLQRLGREFIFSTNFEKPAIHVHSLGAEMPIARMAVGERVAAIAISDNGAAVTIALRSGVVQIHETATGVLCASFEAHYKGVNVVKFSRDSSLLATGGDDSAIHVWSVPELMDAFSNVDGVVNVHRPRRSLAGHTLGVTDLCFGGSGASSRLYSVGLDRTMRIWNLLSEMPIATIFFDTALHSIALDALENAAYCGGDSGAVFEVDLRQTYPPSLNFGSANMGRAFEGHSGRVQSLALNLDDTLLLSGSEDGLAKVWDISTGVCLKTINPFLQSTKAVGVTASSSIGEGVQVPRRARGVTQVLFVPLLPGMYSGERQIVKMSSEGDNEQPQESVCLTLKDLLPALLGPSHRWSGIPLKRYKSSDETDLRCHHLLTGRTPMCALVEISESSGIEEREAFAAACDFAAVESDVMSFDQTHEETEVTLRRKIAALEAERDELQRKNEKLFSVVQGM